MNKNYYKNKEWFIIVANNFVFIRMAFAALEAMEELDLFGIHGGGPSSKIHVMLDEAQKVCIVIKAALARKVDLHRT